MKKIATLLFFLPTTILFSQVKVEEKNVNINGSKNGFYLTIPYGNDKQIDKALNSELNSWKGKVKKEKDYYFADDCSIKEMGDNTFDAYAKVEPIAEGGAYVSVAIDLGGAYMNSGEHGTQFKFMQTKLNTFGISAAKAAVDDEIKAEEDLLKEKQKELADLESDQAKKEKEIEEYKQKIVDNEKAIEESKKNQETKKTEIKEQEVKLETVRKKKEAIK